MSNENLTKINRFGWQELKQLARGKSLGRILMNNYAAEFSLSGRVLDLGSKTDGASYHRYLHWQDPIEIIHTDIESDGSRVLGLDVEKPFPVEDEQFDAVLCFNVLEHIFRTENAVRETRRVLKKGGRMIGTVPFFVRYHPDPQDYFRYTHEALERIAREAGFSNVQITPLGLGPCSTSATIVSVYLPNLIRLFVQIPAIFVDSILFKRKSIREPLGYGFVIED